MGGKLAFSQSTKPVQGHISEIKRVLSCVFCHICRTVHKYASISNNTRKKKIASFTFKILLRLKLENNYINNFISSSTLGYIEILAYMDLLLLPITVVMYMHL